MQKYIVNTVFINRAERKIEKFFYDAYTDCNEANEIALELREGMERGWSTEVVESDE